MTVSIKTNLDGVSGTISIGANDIVKFDQTGITQGAPFSFRNKLINGNFDIWQRGTSFVNPASVYTADRWNAAGTNATGAQVAGFAGYSQYALKITATNTVNSFSISQPLEYSTVHPLMTKKVTLSFYYHSPSSNQPTNSLEFFIQKNSSADTLTGGTWTTFSAVTTVTPTPTIQRASVTVTVPSDGTALGLRPFIRTNNIVNSSVVHIFGIQLECGEVATPFEYRPYGLELSLCQRYYEVGSYGPHWIAGLSASTSSMYIPVYMKTPKRVEPTVSLVVTGSSALWTPAGADANLTNAFLVNATVNSIIIKVSAQSGGLGGIQTGMYYANSEI